MGAEARPVPENGDMGQDEQAALIRPTGDGVPADNEDAKLREEWGEPDADGNYGRNLEAEDVYGGDLA